MGGRMDWVRVCGFNNNQNRKKKEKGVKRKTLF
jgi:hypothetical protein